MQRGYRTATGKLLTRAATSCKPHLRYLSLTGAIEKGIRNGKKAVERERRSWISANGELDDSRLRRQPRYDTETSGSESYDQRSVRGVANRHLVPKSLPYTRADSQFLYGTFAVKAALQARRRHLRTLYVYLSPDKEKAQHVDEIEQSARNIEGLEIKKLVGTHWLQVLGKVSEGRPHNGYVLEASPLPVKELSSLPSTASSTGHFPLYLFLDQIVDPGNLGSILRSAHFFGVDGVIMLTHSSAPLGPVTIKASAGAAEYIPLFKVSDEDQFIQRSQSHGWRFYGAFAEMDSVSKATRYTPGGEGHIPSALSKHPAVLVLGNEATGLRPRIARRLNHSVNIPTSAPHFGIDSLNVGVAAAILIKDFMSSASLANRSSHSS